MIVDAVVRDPVRKLEEITRALSNDLDATNNFAPDGSVGQVLTSNGPTRPPSWQNIPTQTQQTTTAAGAVSSVTGTASRITVSPTTGAVIVNISAAYVGQTSITTLGTIGTGVWQGSSISTTYTDAKITSIVGTLNKIIVSGAAFQDNAFQTNAFQNTTSTAGAVVVSISSSYAGQTSITTLGTIVTGVWQGSSVSTTYTDAKVVSVSGTPGRVSVNNASFQDTMVQSNSFQDTSTSTVGVVLLDISDTYVGQPTITTVGALSSGSIVAGFGGAVHAGDVKITSGGFFVNNTVTGTATLSGGFVVVSSGRVTAASNVFLSDQGGGTSIGAIYEDKSARVPGISFTVRSINVFDSSSFAWFIVEPA